MGEPRCFASRSFICPDTVAGCQVESAACGFDPPGGIGVNPAGGGAQQFAALQTQTADCGQQTLSSACGQQTLSSDCGQQTLSSACRGAIPQTQFCVSQFVRCPSAVDACPTRLCPSRFTPCQSQFVRCPSQLDACPTRYNCPSVAAPCVTQDFSCETRGACPSAVDACPTRFGCYETQVCVSQVCQVSQACGIDYGVFVEAGRPQIQAAGRQEYWPAKPSVYMPCAVSVNIICATQSYQGCGGF